MAYYERKARVSFEQCHNIYDVIEEKHVLLDINITTKYVGFLMNNLKSLEKILYFQRFTFLILLFVY